MYYFEIQLSVQIFFKTVIYVLLYYNIKIQDLMARIVTMVICK